jgi:hypothetical protein
VSGIIAAERLFDNGGDSRRNVAGKQRVWKGGGKSTT